MSTAATRCAPYGSARRRCAELPYSPSQSGCLTQNAPYEGGQKRPEDIVRYGTSCRAFAHHLACHSPKFPVLSPTSLHQPGGSNPRDITMEAAVWPVTYAR